MIDLRRKDVGCRHADRKQSPTRDKAKLIRLHADDNVLVALGAVGPGNVTLETGDTLALDVQVTLGHKVASDEIPKGHGITKYGMPIGIATTDIASGAHVHVHNIASKFTSTHYLDDDAENGDV